MIDTVAIDFGGAHLLGFNRWQLFKGLVLAVGIIGVVSLALSYLIPVPPSKVTMATAFKGSSFEYYGGQYREIFARFNIELELHETAGAVENLKLLQDPKSDVQISYSRRRFGREACARTVVVGDRLQQSIWLFYSSSRPFDRLSRFKASVLPWARQAAVPDRQPNRSWAKPV